LFGRLYSNLSISSATFVKNKAARPFGVAEFKIMFDSAAMNPVVMLCNEAREIKLVKIYKGLWRLVPSVTGEQVETEATSINDLANYLIKNNLVVTLLDKVVETKGSKDPLDGAIMEMKENPSKIVPPTEGDVSITDKRVADVTPEELGDELLEEKPEE